MSDTPQRLVEGQRSDQPTFHALYQVTSPEFRAELIDGVVYLPRPHGVEHGEAKVPVIVWLGYYAAHTPGVLATDTTTLILGRTSEPEPDGLLRILPDCGGRTWIEAGFLHGPPELVVEVSEATRYVDLGPKLHDYERAGVIEYVVRAIDPDEIYWFGQERGTLVPRPLADDGLYRSIVFPGLWLDPIALLNGDVRRLHTVIDLGCATLEHAEFVARLGRAPARRSRLCPAISRRETGSLLQATLCLPADLAPHIRVDVQSNIRHVVSMFAGDEPDDLADRALGIMARHAGKSVRVHLLVPGQLGPIKKGCALRLVAATEMGISSRAK